MSELVFKRYEKKYLLDAVQYNELSERLKAFTEADAYGKYTICSIYYDTPDDRLIRSSLEKPVYKEKLRLRSYGVVSDSDKVFIEIKKKYDGVVYKRREEIKCFEAEQLIANGYLPNYDNQIFREIGYFIDYYKPLAPKAFIAYDREALSGENGLRITFDSGIRARANHLELTYGDEGEYLLDDNMYLMEIKASDAMPLELVKILSDMAIYPTSFSKYGSFYKSSHSGQRRIILPSAVRAAVNM